MGLSRIKTNSIEDSAVTGAKVATGGIATVDMADGSVTSLKIADGGVATVDIANSAVTPAKLSTDAQYMGFKNRIINGAMMIDQRNAGAAQSDSSGNSSFSLDRWRVITRAGATITYGQYDSGGSVSRKHIAITITSGKTPAASEQFRLTQGIEGLNIADLWFGTAVASTITLSFWSCHSQTGTFSGSVLNGGVPSYRSYVFTYTQNAANTWEYKTVTIVGDTSGTWAIDNTAGMYVSFNYGCGSDFLTSTVGSWQAGAYLGSTGSVSPVQTTGAIFRITGVQLEKGSTATSFDYRPYGTELALCQRYYSVISNCGGGYIAGGLTACNQQAILPVSMRATPSAAILGTLKHLNPVGADPTVSTVSVALTSNFSLATVHLTFTSSAFASASAGMATATYPTTATSGVAFSAEL